MLIETLSLISAIVTLIMFFEHYSYLFVRLADINWFTLLLYWITNPSQAYSVIHTSFSMVYQLVMYVVF